MQGHVRLESVSKRYGEVRALQPTNLHVEAGEFFTLLGPSGCGKTTLLRLVGGFLQPTTGKIFVTGRDVTLLPPNWRPTSMVFQNYALFPHMTVAENVAFGPRVRRSSAADVQRRVAQCLEIVRLSHLADRYPAQLSGGQQQRVALARAVAVEPAVLLLDEPLSALDAKLREAMQLELKRIQRELGITTIYVTHDQQEALGMSDRVAVMDHGVVYQVGSAQEIYRNPRRQFVAEFIGRVNLIPGTYHIEGPCFVSVSGTRFRVEPAEAIAQSRPMLMAVRPECLRFGPAPPGGNVVVGIVEKHKYLGSGYQYFVKVSGALTLVAEDGGQDLRARPGDEVQLWWDSREAVLVPPDRTAGEGGLD